MLEKSCIGAKKSLLGDSRNGAEKSNCSAGNNEGGCCDSKGILLGGDEETGLLRVGELRELLDAEDAALLASLRGLEACKQSVHVRCIVELSVRIRLARPLLTCDAIPQTTSAWPAMTFHVTFDFLLIAAQASISLSTCLLAFDTVGATRTYFGGHCG